MTEAERPRTNRLFYGWYVAVIAVVIYFFTNGPSVFVPQSLAPRLMESFGASAGEIGRTTLISFALAHLLRMDDGGDYCPFAR